MKRNRMARGAPFSKKLVIAAVAALLTCAPRTALGEIVIKGKVAIPPEIRTAAQSGSDVPGAGESEPPAAVVYLEGAPAQGVPPKTAKLAQRDLLFVPRLLPIYRGTRVEFPNEDDDYHNVFSYSKVKRFDLGRYRKGDAPAIQVFNDPGVVKVYCEIHRHMRAVILVLDTPYFVKTGQDGAYELALPDLPRGSYTLKAWLDDKTTLERKLELSPGTSNVIDFSQGT